MRSAWRGPWAMGMTPRRMKSCFDVDVAISSMAPQADSLADAIVRGELVGRCAGGRHQAAAEERPRDQAVASGQQGDHEEVRLGVALQCASAGDGARVNAFSSGC